jgi:hypothetical protein
MQLIWVAALALSLSSPLFGPMSGQTSGETSAAPVQKDATPAKQAPQDGGTVKKSAGSSGTTPKRRKRPVASLSASAEGSPRKTVVREGGASEPTAQIVPGIAPEEAAQHRQNAEQLLSSTDLQLKQLGGRTLDVPQQQTVGQVRNYMADARSALQEGDVRRASTLAEKAYLLAEDLMKH